MSPEQQQATMSIDASGNAERSGVPQETPLEKSPETVIPVESQGIEQIPTESEQEQQQESSQEEASAEGKFGRYDSLEALIEGHANAEGFIRNVKGMFGVKSIDDLQSKINGYQAVTQMLREAGIEDPVQGLTDILVGQTLGGEGSVDAMVAKAAGVPVSQAEPEAMAPAAAPVPGRAPQDQMTPEQQMAKDTADYNAMIQRLMDEGAGETSARLQASNAIALRRREREDQRRAEQDQEQHFQRLDQQSMEQARSRDPEGFEKRAPMRQALLRNAAIAGNMHLLLDLAAMGLQTGEIAKRAHRQGQDEAEIIRKGKDAMSTAQRRGDGSRLSDNGQRLTAEDRETAQSMGASEETLGRIGKFFDESGNLQRKMSVG